MEELLEERRGRVLLATLNRPDRLNAFTADQYARLERLLRRTQEDDSLSVLVITGAGRAFSSGADLSIFQDRDHAARATESFGPLIRALAGFDKPLIAAVNGLAVGFGATLLLHCDLVLASPEARLRYPFVELETSPEAASSHLLPALIGAQRAAELLFEGGWVNAESAAQLGLFARLIAPDGLVAEAIDVATRFSEGSLPALRAAKTLLIEGRRDAIEAALSREFEQADLLASNRS